MTYNVFGGTLSLAQLIKILNNVSGIAVDTLLVG